jgi:hypothetical protein
MSFTAPFLLAALALLAPVLLAFLVRRRRDVLRVPSTLLWRLAGVPSAQNRRFKNLRRVVSLVACLLGVAALVLAAARPVARDRGETVAFVIDVSASMDAGGRGSPLARARRFVAARLAAGGAGDRYVIVAAGASPVRLAGPAAPGSELDAALEGLHTERGGADVDAAIELAAALVANDHAARVVLLGDGGESAGGLLTVREVPVSRRVFPPVVRDNLGIAAFATRPTADARDDEREALVTIATSSAKPRGARLVVSVEGKEIARRHVDVPARGQAEVRLRVLAVASRLAARVEPDDGIADALASDDEAVLAGAARPAPRVLLVTKSDDDAESAAFFVEKALAAAGVKEIVRVRPSFEGMPPQPGDVVVALAEGPTRSVSVPALYLGTSTGVLPFAGLRELEHETTHLRSLDARDPLLRGVALDGVTVEHATAAALPPGARALVDLDGGTVMLAGGAGARAFVYLGIDPARSDLVLRVAFPVLVANALHALAGAADVVVADTVARPEIALQEAAPELLAPTDEPEARFHPPLRPALLLAFAGAALLALEMLAWRKGWSS